MDGKNGPEKCRNTISEIYLPLIIGIHSCTGTTGLGSEVRGQKVRGQKVRGQKVRGQIL